MSTTISAVRAGSIASNGCARPQRLVTRSIIAGGIVKLCTRTLPSCLARGYDATQAAVIKRQVGRSAEDQNSSQPAGSNALADLVAARTGLAFAITGAFGARRGGVVAL